MLAAAALGLPACQLPVGDIDGVFYNGDGRKVHCAVNLDATSRLTHASIDSGLDRAVANRETIELYAHHPGDTIAVSEIAYVVTQAEARGLAFVTYEDFAAGGGTGPALALSFDDTWVTEWAALIPMFAAHGVHATFFVSRYDHLGDERHRLLHDLADAGHAIEAHSVNHYRAPEYVENHGLHDYIDNELVPSIQVLRAEGFAVNAFAYPFGARTSELDDAILDHVAVVRSVSFPHGAPVESPCPD